MIGRDQAGRTVITLAVDDRLLCQLLGFDAGAEDFEDGGDAELDGPPVLSFDRVPVSRVYRGRRSSSGRQLRKIVHR